MKKVYILKMVLVLLIFGISCKTISLTDDKLIITEFDILIESQAEEFWFDLGKFIIKGDTLRVYKMDVIDKRLNTKYTLDTIVHIDYLEENMLNVKNNILLIDSTCQRSFSIIGYEPLINITVKKGENEIKRSFFNYLPIQISELFHEINKKLNDREIKYWLENVKECN